MSFLLVCILNWKSGDWLEFLQAHSPRKIGSTHGSPFPNCRVSNCRIPAQRNGSVHKSPGRTHIGYHQFLLVLLVMVAGGMVNHMVLVVETTSGRKMLPVNLNCQQPTTSSASAPSSSHIQVKDSTSHTFEYLRHYKVVCEDSTDVVTDSSDDLFFLNGEISCTFELVVQG
ncbi:Hypothetical predicted protein [Paramuricea clavata]|uniref:Uncharacterized protein n=1 Tax=Paramuricea clavata TaxID=317549 RepID=A0A6S7GA12_PARCT|nr:Hypothetical predicted protein [Paramuricea clavata]